MLKHKNTWYENRYRIAVLSGIAFIFLCLTVRPAFAEGVTTDSLVFILDASGSMETHFENRMKMEILKDTMIREIEKLPETVKIGLVVYGSEKKSDCEDVQVVVSIDNLGKQKIQALQRIRRLEPVGMTPIANAIEKTMDLIARRNMKPTVILIADGQDSCLGDPCAIVRKRTRTNGFVFNVIGFDVTRGAERQLECIAEAGGGAYYAADSVYALRTALDNAVHNIASPVLTSRSKDPEVTDLPDLPVIELEDRDIWNDEPAADTGGKGAARSVSPGVAGESTFVISMTGTETGNDTPEQGAAVSEPHESGLDTKDETAWLSEAPVEQRTVIVQGGRVRQEPSLESPIKFLMPRGTTADVMDKQGDWFHVRLDDGRSGWSHKSLFGDIDSLKGNFLKTIDVGKNERGEEKVVFHLTSFIPPKTFFMEKGDPRVVCDFKDTKPMRTIRRKMDVNGELIKTIRTAVHEGSRFRVVLDLTPGKKYELAHLYSRRNNKYTLIVKDVE